MPAIIEIPLRITQSNKRAAPTRSHVHAAVSRAVGELDHHANVKPYSIWPLALSPDESEMLLRIGWLTDELPFALLSRASWWFGGLRARSLGPQVSHYPWIDLVQAPAVDHVHWDFVSPTAFERSGINYPLPDPRLMIDSLVRRWNAYCPLGHIDDGQARTLTRVVEPDLLRLRDQPFEAPHAWRRGFVGEVGWHLVPEAGSDEGRMLGALADFARCSGVGYLTSQGYGACWTETRVARPIGRRLVATVSVGS